MRRPDDFRYPLVLLAAYAALWTVLAFAPAKRDVWLVENALVVAVVPLLVLSARRFRFSDASYSAVFVFLVLHAIGSHFTYSAVPLDLSLLDPARNPYDRVVHFSFGLLAMIPASEFFARRLRIRGAWPRVLAWQWVIAVSALFEIGEWLVTILVPGETATAYLASQGDAFDAFKDVGLAALGAALSGTVAHFVQGRRAAAARRPWRQARLPLAGTR